MLTKIKKLLRITSNAFDEELIGLIDAAFLYLDLDLITIAVATYVKLHFGEPSDPDQIKMAYDEQKAQLRASIG